MSRLLADRVSVRLQRDSVVVFRRPWRGAASAPRILVLDAAGEGEAPWQPAVRALAAGADGHVRARDRVSVIVASDFARYVIAPGSQALRGVAEESAHSHQCFTAVHGAGDTRWVVQSASPNPRRPRLVCGLESPLVEALKGAAGQVGFRLHAVQPALVAAFNRSRHRLGWPGAWMASVEPGTLCLALIADGEWKTVRCEAVAGDWRDVLPRALAREELLHDGAVDCERVVLIAGGTDPVAARMGKWQIEQVA